MDVPLPPLHVAIREGAKGGGGGGSAAKEKGGVGREGEGGG